ncbi:FAD:protein FMN transferase [uncultured Hoeflea sp.]|uniref:FAD:protein FMN transferase n=1 Tax=uncultured Hoeflea sp. TaxID=538666 RepID=UPI0026095AA0|nr:FAD:protein FMN transferase [uncultured Hoeflea sp.]
MSITRRNLLFSTAAMATGLAASASSAVHVLGATGGQAFGSTWRLAWSGAASEEAVRSHVLRVVEQTNASMSPYRSESELSLFNRSRSSGWQHVSPDLSVVVSDALAVSRLTEGAFDPTVGPLVARYGFGPISGGRGKLEDLHIGAGALRKITPDLTLDLCGIAKGYALDRIIGGLADLGVRSALLELGGEVRCIGQHPDGRPWRVGIERPDAADGAMQRIIAPRDLALATSGTGRQGAAFGPHGISHLIDPGHRRPVSGAPASVSVLAESAMRADALATALMVMGPETGPDFARDHAIRALFLRYHGNGWQEIMTAGFDRHLIL